mgnify:FL=1
MAEAIQKLVLETLDAQGEIKDTRSLVLPGETEPAASQDAQLLILGALNSLLSREVRPQSNTRLTSTQRHTDDYIPTK